MQPGREFLVGTARLGRVRRGAAARARASARGRDRRRRRRLLFLLFLLILARTGLATFRVVLTILTSVILFRLFLLLQRRRVLIFRDAAVGAEVELLRPLRRALGLQGGLPLGRQLLPSPLLRGSGETRGIREVLRYLGLSLCVFRRVPHSAERVNRF